MKTIKVIYRHEDDGAWIGTSPEVPGYTAHGDTYAEARERAMEGFPWFAEEDAMVIAHLVPTAGPAFKDTAGYRVGLTAVEVSADEHPAFSGEMSDSLTPAGRIS